MKPERMREIVDKYTIDFPHPCDFDKLHKALLAAIAEAVDETIEECARVCEEHYSIEGIAQKCAAAIRAMKGNADPK